MKLLLDQNLSPRLVVALADIYPESMHVKQLGMDLAPDHEILDFARENGFILVSKDSDFMDPQLIRGQVAKTIWIRRGNCTTTEIETILRRQAAAIQHLAESNELSLLMFY